MKNFKEEINSFSILFVYIMDSELT